MHGLRLILQLYRPQPPAYELQYISGQADSVSDGLRWLCFPDYVRAAQILLLARPGASLDACWDAYEP